MRAKSNSDVLKLLEQASPDQRESLRQILDAPSPDPDKLISTMCQQSLSMFGTFKSGFTGQEPVYRDLLNILAKRVRAQFSEHETDAEVEAKITQKLFNTMVEKLTPEERKELERNLRDAEKEVGHGKTLVKGGGTLAALAAAQLSGFGVYMLASTTLGAITGAIGVTLPFAVYTTMSSAISVLIGPVGWVFAGLCILNGLSQPNCKKLASIVLFITALRYENSANLIHDDTVYCDVSCSHCQSAHRVKIKDVTTAHSTGYHRFIGCECCGGIIDLTSTQTA